MASSKEVARLNVSDTPLLCVAFSPDGSRIVACPGDSTLRVWDVTASKEVAVMKGHKQPANDANFSPDGTRVVSASADLTLRVWDAASGKELLQIWGPQHIVYKASFSPDGTKIVSGGYEKVVRIFRASDGIQVAALEHEERFETAAFSPDGAKLVTGDYGDRAQVWDIAARKIVLTLAGHESTVADAQCSPDGSRIVTASEDRTARVWDAATGKVLAVLKDDAFDMVSASFSPDGTKILTASGPYARVWSKAGAVAMPEAAVGVWMADLAIEGEELPPEISSVLCIMQPMAVRADGLVIMFDAGEDGQTPAPQRHLRCDVALSCQYFEGPPGPGLTALAAAKLSLEGKKAKLCIGEECTVYARCPDIPWTDEQKAAGLPEKWKDRVLGNE